LLVNEFFCFYYICHLRLSVWWLNNDTRVWQIETTHFFFL
jgi:hypothetical protein